ncbi:class I SAM-dependent methyltransferase [Roseateles violae]|uniref:Class I SAM-dependent methyltransferase n=1 Tax=Roseateles violae TaxID=3058042 RepID=A0ABT8DTT4_9BURK|nr:class I SAM-dependent methyltransferase [Pelomonas sp. PFR6]MDN3919787.1 class I SAM-dependent methyltransferase [Pelomonas sp. PFR6]
MFLPTRWPLPALLGWAAAWLLFSALRAVDVEAGWALTAAALLGAGLALLQAQRWRRLIVALGFPLSVLINGTGSAMPAWTWLLPLALLALVYPRRSWGDAPLFPSPAGALARLAELAPLPAGATVLDAGCGLGHGLRELRRAYPAARIEGIEWSGLLALLARLRCRWAHIARGDLWAQHWSRFDLVYVFQRPETMARIWVKAEAQLRPGAWLVSLDFAVPALQPLHALELGGGHRLWIYYKAAKTVQMQRSSPRERRHTQDRRFSADMG